MDVYSVTLAASMVFLAAAFLALAMGGLNRVWIPSLTDQRLMRIISSGSAGSILLAIVSAGVHLATGHLPGSPNAMGPLEFLREHISFVVVGMLAVGVICVGRSRIDHR